MNLKEILQVISVTAKENKLSTPYLVGGFPRDVYMQNLENISDVDITCGDASSLQLGQFVIKKLEGATLTTFNDGHTKLNYQKFSIDFSSNFKIAGINAMLKASGIEKPTPMQEELYSRDFIANTLLMPLDLSNILDIIGLGINNIDDKIIDTCLPPRITLTYDPKRIIRIVYLCTKLDFKPANGVVAWVRKNGNLLTKVSDGYIKSKLNKSLKINTKRTIELIKELNLSQYIPQTELLRNVTL